MQNGSIKFMKVQTRLNDRMCYLNSFYLKKIELQIKTSDLKL